MKKKNRAAGTTAASDAAWAAQPASGEWNSNANWTPAAVPTDTATFSASSQTVISFAPGSSATVNSIDFAADAPSYTFTFNAPAPSAPALTIAGAGISNGSAGTQSFVVTSSAQSYQQPQLKFIKAATAGGPGVSYAVGPATPSAAGGGVIGFCDSATAGSASFTVTTGAGTPEENSTVGGEVSFSDSSSAGTAQFTVYGSTSTTDGGYTFGNVVFHDTASAANAAFTNAGGTVSPGDGGNTQFYDDASAASGLFHNMGGTVSRANGGDVAFDGTSTAAGGHFHNYAATASGGYGGVTSFNNNTPRQPATLGATAGNGVFHNYGARASGQGGGHTSFSAMHGSPTAASGTFFNHGSAVADSQSSAAGHTIFSITVPQDVAYCPDAGSGVFWNLPGTAAGAPGGYTELTVYTQKKGDSISGSTGPRAGTATFINLGAVTKGAQGGQTSFRGTSSAQSARLLALGGVNGGSGGKITFSDYGYGEEASVSLQGNGTLSISDYYEDYLMIGDLELAPGQIEITLGKSIKISGSLTIPAGPAVFSFTSGSGFEPNTPYTILTAPNLSTFSPAQFTGALGNSSATFSIVGNDLQVSFGSGTQDRQKGTPARGARTTRKK